MENSDIECAVESILFASGDPVSAERIASVLGTDAETILAAAGQISDRLSFERRGIRLVRMEHLLQLCSAPEYADIVRLCLETRKPPQLSQPALEVLAIAAYFQPVTRTYIEQIRGVDSSYTVNLLIEKGLLEECGKLAVPGRPSLFRTTPGFLRTFGISSLDELPVLPDSAPEDNETQKQMLQAINTLKTSPLPNTNSGEES